MNFCEPLTSDKNNGGSMKKPLNSCFRFKKNITSSHLPKYGEFTEVSEMVLMPPSSVSCLNYHHLRPLRAVPPWP